MIKAMFQLYDFIIKNNIAVHYVDWKGNRDNEIIISIDPMDYEEFAKIIVEHFTHLISDGEYYGTVTMDGSLQIDIMPLIEHYCMIEDAEMWDMRYRQLGECQPWYDMK